MGRNTRRVLLVISAVLITAALGALGYVAISLRKGYFDARSRFATGPDFLYATEEPLWFYGLLLAMTALALYSLYIGWGMMRYLRRGAPHPEKRSEHRAS